MNDIKKLADLDFNNHDYVIVHRSNEAVGDRSIEEKLDEFELPSDVIDEKGNSLQKYWNLIGTFTPPPDFDIKFHHKNDDLFKKYYQSRKYTYFLYEITKGLDKQFVDVHNNNDNFNPNILEFYSIGLLRKNGNTKEILFVPNVKSLNRR
ncbi:hypothetical protein Glove_120g183 [Diversispora epigaea]|uniref:Uncharacterized protein n=1 Tax=Diversispora epigaea TaxID=1348612 RepID=A0A397IZC2_9GLOM|nr:hypothetical protein Glove_120g183 [Diversispora epigaea]